MEDNIKFERINSKNFDINSLDTYNRYQETEVNLRLVNGQYLYKNEPFIETWDNVQLHETANEVIKAVRQGSIGFIAKYQEKIIGFTYLGTNYLGNEKQYIELIMFHVTKEYRNKGIGKKLFKLICGEAKKLPAKKLYISANSAKETQEVYKALGCVFAEEVQEKILDYNPYDVQLEYIL